MLASEIQNPPGERGDWGTEIAEYRGKCYKLMGFRDSEIKFPGFSLVATCVSRSEAGCQSIEIVDLSEPK